MASGDRLGSSPARPWRHRDEQRHPLPNMLTHSMTTHSLLTDSVGASSMASLSHTMSKTDIRPTKNRLEAQWRMNRVRQVYDLRRTFQHFCITQGLGTATEAPTEFYDRYQADAGVTLLLSKQEVRSSTHRPSYVAAGSSPTHTPASP